MSLWSSPLTLAQLNDSAETTLVRHLGILFTEIGEEFLRGTMPVDSRTWQPFGLLHGGASVVLAETLGSTAANMCVDTTQYVCVGQEINANHVRSARGGQVTGTARLFHQGGRTQVWGIEIVNEAQDLICISRLTMAVIKRGQIPPWVPASICNIDWRIVRAMKHPTHRLLAGATGLCAVMAIAPLAGAQPPASQAPPPAAVGVPAPATPPPPPSSVPPDVKDQAGYLFGLTFGEQMHSVGLSSQVDPETIARGIKDGLAGKKSNRTDQQQIQAFVQSSMTEYTAHNKQAAKDFLDKNGKEKNVKTTASGLEYKVLAAGDAKAPAIQAADEVTVQYRGKLIDGTEFDSSYSRGVPATFKVGGVIHGWQEALQLMKPGSKYQLFIPPELAYDTTPKPGIPPGSLLIFDVEVVSVKAGTPPAGATAPVTPQSHKAMTPPLPAAPAQ